MKNYFAPMEGVTTYIYRNAYQQFFGNVDKYFSPFIIATQSDRLKSRELNDILPEHNQNIILIPQLLTNHAESFIKTAEKIKKFGYNEINLNLGCPSRTVVAKQKGAGFLADIEALDSFLDHIFTKVEMKISIKTRIGKEHPEEWSGLVECFNRYPLEELIVHPRVQTDYYKNVPNWEAFAETLKYSKHKISYNGDVFKKKDYEKVIQTFPKIDSIMLGRGLISNPDLMGQISNSKRVEKNILLEFHNQIYEEYKKVVAPDKNVLYKMKEIWFYMSKAFTNHEKYLKKIKKAETLDKYNQVVDALFTEQELVL